MRLSLSCHAKLVYLSNNVIFMFKDYNGLVSGVFDRTKDVWAKIKLYDSKHPNYIYILLACLGFLVLIHPFSEDSIISFFKVYLKKRELTRELVVVRDKYRVDSIRLDQLKHDGGALERVAREDYLMKSPNEIIFIVKKTEENAN